MRRTRKQIECVVQGSKQNVHMLPIPDAYQFTNSHNVIHPLIDDRHSAIFIAGKTSVREKANEA